MRKGLSMWAAFVLYSFLTLLATGFILFFILCLIRLLQIDLDQTEPTPLVPLGLFILASVVIGTFMSSVTGRKAMRFYFEFRDAMKRVASGDFTTRIKSGGKIHEVEILAEDFNKMARELATIETLKNDFITSVSHEIKTPVASIEGCAELLKDESLTDAERREYVNLIELSAKRLSTMTANILRLSKLENQEIAPETKEFRLDEEIRQAILLLEHKWSEKQIDFQIALIPVTISANKELFALALVNILDNAVKFSPKGGVIEVALTVTSGFAQIKIGDQGVGMDADTLKHIFQKFYQGGNAPANQGNGLGLSLAKRIIEMSGGGITAESEEGKGSEFFITIAARELPSRSAS